MPQLSTRSTAAELDRQVHRLYAVARRARALAGILTHPQATGDGVAYASARIPRALSAAQRLLALPGVAAHQETPYALSFLTQAEQQLNAPSTSLLRLPPQPDRLLLGPMTPTTISAWSSSGTSRSAAAPWSTPRRSNRSSAD
ncbi:hypothetical protein [Streptomyces echinatus]|uniref:Uncharacterized protein n=1 Tax=Streptomyces echinatus TaxID=67293 RepID=A0A7W9Q3U8_9ACTN|nr:hypothetical protein [Streptomyces echinatus]MBB5932901.1 hypothetical protein [Streptomyces echinatus]